MSTTPPTDPGDGSGDRPVAGAEETSIGAPSQALVLRAKEGSAEARNELFNHIHPTLEKYLKRKVGSRLGRAISVSDIAQESFVQAFGAMQHLSPGAGVEDFRGLLFKNAHWLLHKAARRHQNFVGESVVGQPLPMARPAGPTASSPGEVTRRDESGWLARQIDRLSPEDARVLHLRGQGLEFQEIADELGIQLEAARKRCLRAARRLRTLIEGT